MLKWFFGIALVFVFGIAFYLFQYGGWRVKRDIASFADHLSECSPMDQDFYDPLSGNTMNRRVEGMEDNTCRVSFDTYSPQRLYCAFAVDDLPTIANGLRARANNVDWLGGFKLAYNSDNPDPLTTLFSSSACEARDP